MQFFSIRDIEKMSGIKAHTFRIWEQRYQLLTPKRKESKHRMYDNEDLKHVLRIAFLYNKGYKISKIAHLGEDEIRRLAIEARPGSENYPIFVNQLAEASIDFDQSLFEKILNNLILHIGFEKCVIQVLFPLLNKLGLLWMTDSVSPAQEHFASSIVIRKMIIAIDGLDPVKMSGSRKVLLFTPENEFHEIPLLFMLYLLKKNRIETLYLGTNVSLESIKEFAGQNVTQLYFHFVTNLLRDEFGNYLKKLSSFFPNQEVVFSGSRIYLESLPANVKFLRSADDMLAFCR